VIYMCLVHVYTRLLRMSTERRDMAKAEKRVIFDHTLRTTDIPLSSLRARPTPTLIHSRESTARQLKMDKRG